MEIYTQETYRVLDSGWPASEAEVTCCDNTTSYNARKYAFHHLCKGLNGEESLLSLISHVAFDIVQLYEEYAVIFALLSCPGVKLLTVLMHNPTVNFIDAKVTRSNHSENSLQEI